MKLKAVLIACSAAVLIFTSCTSKPQSLKGKWSFKTLQGAYSELWLDGKTLLTVKSDTRNPYLFDYNQNGDTIVIYKYGSSGNKAEEIDRFLIEKQGRKKVTILQDTIHNELKLITEEIAVIKNTKSYRDSALLEFNTRAQSEK